jgi:hypothetical protein
MARALWVARKKPGVDAADAALVFSASDGGHLDRGQVYRVVKAAAKTASVPWAGLHTLRHSCATILFRRGWNAVQVQKMLGHHSPAFTLAVYVHLLPDDLPEPTFLDELGLDRPVADGAKQLGEDAVIGRFVVEGGVDLDREDPLGLERSDARDVLEPDAVFSEVESVHETEVAVPAVFG